MKRRLAGLWLKQLVHGTESEAIGWLGSLCSHLEYVQPGGSDVRFGGRHSVNICRLCCEAESSIEEGDKDDDDDYDE